jgi:hypothetical protein
MDPFSALLIALHAVPVLLGAFAGTLLVARELETGTFRFTWTQAAGRRRNLAVSLAVLAVPVVVGACVLGLMPGPHAHVFEVAGPDSVRTTGIFGASPLVLAAWCLPGLAIGVLIGALTGTVVAAIATSAVVLGAAALFSSGFVRRLFAIAPAVRHVPGPVWLGSGSLSQPAPRGQEMSGSWLVSSWLTVRNRQRLCAASTERFPGESAASKRDPGAWPGAHHLGYFVSYQPAGRYRVFKGPGAPSCSSSLRSRLPRAGRDPAARFSPGLMAGGRPQPKRKTTLSGGATLRKRLLIVRDACLSSPRKRRASSVTVSSVPSRSCSAAAIFVLMGLRVVISLS